MKRSAFLASIAAASLALGPTAALAQDLEAAPEPVPEADSAAGLTDGTALAAEAAAPRDPVPTIATLGVIALGSFGAGAGMLVAASGTFDDRDAIVGDGLYDAERRNTLDLKGQSQQVLGVVFIGLGALATTGFGVLTARHIQAKRGADIALAPTLLRRGAGVSFSARF